MKIVIVAGSNRKGATSTSLAQALAKRMERRQIEAVLFDLYESPLPFYSPDESADWHAGVVKLRKLMLEADGIVLATPEYHGAMSGVLKNALDFLSKDHFKGKAVLSASSAGGAVGVSSLQQLQAVVRNLHGINSPEWISIGGAQRAGYENGTLARLDPRSEQSLEAFLQLAEALMRNKEEAEAR
ncbi:NADPH-dependent FMN reductase [Paenibacillus protaetiae]|uniref:NAD(P)H-dependent oxidoreductase n=1 Tax=Paenibacillus protaetiae TaxID=2509456 RepID=A0A4P6F070_9BACL|nr:NADPH-dependent FMN reductase [Paenibacillus protaetiae]QAY67983.1 NAD(P)H-dependent oxidoreductase [Paenibacillus protaetiae]